MGTVIARPRRGRGNLRKLALSKILNQMIPDGDRHVAPLLAM